MSQARRWRLVTNCPAPGKGAVVDAERHAHRRFFHRNRRQRLRKIGVSQRVADAHVGDARHGYDVARLGIGHVDALQVAKDEDLAHLAGDDLPVRQDLRYGLTGVQHAATQPADRDLAHVAAVLQRRHQHLHRPLSLDGRPGQVLEDRVEERAQIVRQVIGRIAGPHLQRLGVDHGEVGLLLVGAQVYEQVKGGVDRVVEPRRRPVHLVDHDDGLQPLFQRLAQHEARLRHGAFHRVHQEQHAVYHVHDALDFAAEVGVPRRIDDIDRDALIEDAGVLRQNGDAPFPLQVVRVEHALHHLLIAAKDVGLAQHPVDQRRLAVVHMGDDRHIADVGAHLACFCFRRDCLFHTPPLIQDTKRPAPSYRGSFPAWRRLNKTRRRESQPEVNQL